MGADNTDLTTALKASLMDVLLTLSERENEARADDDILLADQIYGMRGQITDTAGVVNANPPAPQNALAALLNASQAAHKNMSDMQEVMPSANALKRALDALQEQLEDNARQDTSAISDAELSTD